MTKQKRRLTAEEAELWCRVAQTAKPLTERKAVDAKAKAPTSAKAAQKTFAPPAKAIAPAAKSSGPQNRANERRVRRGKIDVGGMLDLHGHTQASGEAALARFLRAAHGRGERVVVVVTGIGRGGDGVLKRRLPDWLHANRALVTGFAPAHRAHGGAGATYVFLRRRAED